MSQPTSSVSCLCGKVSQNVEIDPTVKHSALQFCHCNSCRFASGLLYFSYLILQSKPHLDSNLKEYKQSGNISRWFCATCGAHAFAYNKRDNKYRVAAGLLTTTEAGEAESITHHGVKDTLDGGLSIVLPGSITEDNACWLDAITTEGQAVTALQTPGSLNNDILPKADLLEGQCHCGGIQFSVTRPKLSSRSVSSPWPDLLVPYYSSSSENSQDIKWWLRADETKYLAGLCACKSCRLASGVDIQPWAFIPKTNIFQVDGSQLAYGTGSMQQLESSPNVWREFCNRCGATIFWHCQDRPGVVDVSVGLLRAKTGARAEDWLEWATGRVSFAEEAKNEKLIAMLERSLRYSSSRNG